MPQVSEGVGPSVEAAPVKINKLPKRKKKDAKAQAAAAAAPQPQVPEVKSQDDQGEHSSHRATLHKHLRKTRFCMYHLQGACQFGSECSFAHSLAEMHQTPDLRKTQLCKAYFEGNCEYENCMFAHSDQELRSTDMFFKKTLCIWHEKGKCRNGEKCRFAHGSKEMRARQQVAGNMDAMGAPGKGKGKGRQFNDRAGYSAPGGSTDPMQIHPGDLMLAAASLLPPASQPQPLPQARAGNEVGANGHNLNAELSQLCQSIAVLTAQCSNIQKRMQLEAEFNSIQQQAANIGMSPLMRGPGGSAGLSYAGLQEQRPLPPYPPGLNSLCTADLGISPEMSESVAAALQSLEAMNGARGYTL